ncbi:MAG TPA: hypothetical protein PLV25_01965 [Opitutales bacterium]|nr:hypothetical protein [Opitutales bacterium]
MSEKKPSPLTRLESLLQDEDFTTHLESVTPEHPVEQLFVALGQDDKGRSHTVTIHYVNDVTNALGGTDAPEDAIILQFFLPLPYECKPEHMDAFARMALVVNRLLPVGAFGITDPEGMAYLQYNLATGNRNVEAKVICEVLGMMAFFTNEFGPKIEAVGLGELSRDQYVEELASGGIDLPGLKAPKA